MMNPFRKFSMYLFIVLGLLNLSAQIYYYSDYIHFIETYISPDNHVSFPLSISFAIDLLFIFSIVILYLQKIFYIDWNDFKLSNVNIIDKVAISSIVIIIILYLSRKQVDFIRLSFTENHFFENLTVIFALLTSVFLAINLIKFHDRFSKVFLILSSLAFFYFGMEEISWGQNIFKWNTPLQFEKLNYQKESNTHNLFNPYFTIFYIFFNFIIASILLFSKRIKSKLERYLNENFKYLIPSNAYLYYAIIFSFLTIQSYYNCGGELTEEIFSIFGLSFSINLSLKKNEK